MSQTLIRPYLTNLQVLRGVSGTGREAVVSEALKRLPNGLRRSCALVFRMQYLLTTGPEHGRHVEGVLLHRPSVQPTGVARPRRPDAEQ